MKEPIDLSLEDDEEDKSLEQIKMDKTADKLSRIDQHTYFLVPYL